MEKNESYMRETDAFDPVEIDFFPELKVACEEVGILPTEITHVFYASIQAVAFTRKNESIHFIPSVSIARDLKMPSAKIHAGKLPPQLNPSNIKKMVHVSGFLDYLTNDGKMYTTTALQTDGHKDATFWSAAQLKIFFDAFGFKIIPLELPGFAMADMSALFKEPIIDICPAKQSFNDGLLAHGKKTCYWMVGNDLPPEDDVTDSQIDPSIPIKGKQQRFGDQVLSIFITDQEFVDCTCDECVHLLLPDRTDIYTVQPHSVVPQRAKFPHGKVKNIRAALNYLFVLTQDGQVYHRLGSRVSNEWEKIEIPEKITEAAIGHSLITLIGAQDCYHIYRRANLGLYVSRLPPACLSALVPPARVTKKLNRIPLTHVKPPESRIISPPRLVEDDPIGLLPGFQSQKFTDVNFEVEGKKIQGHKTILMMRSKYFETILQGQSGDTIKITDCSFVVFSALMEYIYSGELKNGLLLSQLLSLHPIAKKSDDVALLSHLRKKLQMYLAPSSVMSTMEACEKLHADDLKHLCVDYVLRQTKEVFAHKEWRTIGRENPQMMMELIAILAEKKKIG